MSTYHQEMKEKFPGRPFVTRPTWELLNMRKALSLLGFFNTPEENQRLADVKAELKARRAEGRK